MPLIEMHFAPSRTSSLRFCPPAYVSTAFEDGGDPNRVEPPTLLPPAKLFLSKDRLNPVSYTITRHAESQCGHAAVPHHLPGPCLAGRPPWPFISLFLEAGNPTRVAGPPNLPFTLGKAHTGTGVSRVALRGRQFSGLRPRKTNLY